jgi:hypothetical protein
MKERDLLPSPVSRHVLAHVIVEEGRKEAALAGEMEAAVAREPECKRRREQAAVRTPTAVSPMFSGADPGLA